MLRFQYYLVKAYEYRFLVPFGPIDLRRDSLFQDVRSAPRTASQPVLSPVQVAGLAKVLAGSGNKVVIRLGQQLRNPPQGAVGGIHQQVSKARFHPTADHLQGLDAHGTIELDFMAGNVIHPDWENAKIEAIVIKAVKAVPGSLPKNPNTTCGLAVEAWGDGMPPASWMARGRRRLSAPGQRRRSSARSASARL